MLIAARHLVDRLRHPRSRADEVAELRRRLVAASGPGDVSAEALLAARELRRLRIALADALGEVGSCSGCARGHPLPAGRWNGGHCCSGRTAEIFSDDEVAGLRLAGTTPGKLKPPRSDHAGCAFRGPTGCSLAVEDRPSICVSYLCLDLRAELDARGDLGNIKRLVAELRTTFARFTRARSAPNSRGTRAPASRASRASR